MKKLLTAATIGLLSIPSAALACPDFSTVDTDANGVISFPEAAAVFPGMTEAEFAAFDTNQDGVWSEEEYAVWCDRT